MTDKAAREKQAPRLASLAEAVGGAKGAAKLRGPAPVDRWTPPYCGEIDMRIAADGTWYYEGTPINRPAMVSLFAGILRKDPERYVLVTPVECVGITVEDAPFVAVAMVEAAGTLRFASNMGEEVEAGASHGLRFTVGAEGGVKPYVHIRGGLWARLTRTLAMELLDRSVTETCEGVATIGIRSGQMFFPICPAERALG